MNKLPIAGFLIATAVAATSIEISAQYRPVQRGGGSGPFQVIAQVRRINRFPQGRRGVNRPPFGLPQPGRNRPPNPNQARKQQMQQRLLQAIGLSSEQRMRMQDIRRSHEDEIIAAGRRIRLARQALDRAIMNETYSESEVR
ncbi:MAG: hypothetical protein WAV20_11790, partial [Blastocatellia bacterium]